MKRILVPCLVLTLGACADNRSMIEIDGRAAPSDATSCKFAPGGENIMGPGLLDVGSSLTPSYSLVVYVKNNLVDPKTLAPDALTSAKAWTANTAKIKINPSDFVNTFGPNPALADGVSYDQNVTLLDGTTLQPACGTGVVGIEAVSGALGSKLSALVAPGDLKQIVLGISIQGHTLDGNFLESNDWYFPLNLCNGCLAAPTTCPTGQVVTASNCFGMAQDTVPVCAAPAQ